MWNDTFLINFIMIPSFGACGALLSFLRSLYSDIIKHGRLTQKLGIEIIGAYLLAFLCDSLISSGIIPFPKEIYLRMSIAFLVGFLYPSSIQVIRVKITDVVLSALAGHVKEDDNGH